MTFQGICPKLCKAVQSCAKTRLLLVSEFGRITIGVMCSQLFVLLWLSALLDKAERNVNRTDN